LRFLKKLKADLPYDPAIPLLGMYPSDYQSMYKRGTCIPVFAAGVQNSQAVETVNVSNGN
jgi:hypothetical protein